MKKNKKSDVSIKIDKPKIKLGRHTKHQNKRRKKKPYVGQGR